MIYEKGGVDEIQGVPEKTHFLNGRFVKTGLTVRGLPLTALLQWKATYPQSQFRKMAFQKMRFFQGHQVFHQLPLSHKSHSPSLI